MENNQKSYWRDTMSNDTWKKMKQCRRQKIVPLTVGDDRIVPLTVGGDRIVPMTVDDTRLVPLTTNDNDLVPIDDKDRWCPIELLPKQH